MSQDAESAIEVTDVNSAAAAIEARWTAAEQQPEPEQETAEVEEVETDEQSEQVDEESDDLAETDEVEAESDNESESDEPEADEDEALQFENVSQLAEALDMSPEDFLANIKITRKIDGVEEEVTLAELRDGNQRDADYRRKTTALAEERKAFSEEKAAKETELARKLQEADIISTNLERQLMADFESIDWNRLEIDDREEWLVQRQKYGERYQQIQSLKGKAQQDILQYQEELKQRQQEARQQRMVEEAQRLREVIPSWNDETVQQADAKQMVEFLQNYGFNADEIEGAEDHRLFWLAYDAMKQRGKKQEIDTAKKKLKSLPKIVKPGNKQDKVAVKKKQQQDKIKQLRQTGGHKIDDIAAALMDRM